MAELAHRPDTVAARGKLFLTFRIGQERFALAAQDVAEVLARPPLKPIAKMPAWVAGVFAHRGEVVPVLDMTLLLRGEAALDLTSTRLVLVPFAPDPTLPARRLGLILEHATDTLRCDPAQFRDYGLDNPDARYLGPVREDADGLLQWIRVADLLGEPVRRLLFPAAEAVVREDE